MKATKILAAILASAILTCMPFAVSVSADDDLILIPSEYDDAGVSDDDITSVPSFDQKPEYACIEGTIKDINNYVDVNGEIIESKQIVSIEKDENEWTAIMDNDTYYITFGNANRKAMGVGDSVKVFYNINAPMIMIYPPQVNAEFAALNFPENKSIAIDRFDENFTDSKNNLKLNIGESTEIIYQDGKDFDGEIKHLINRKLIVIYSVTTRSIPAQTAPEQIIVMYEKAAAPVYPLTEAERDIFIKACDAADIVVNGKIIDAPKAYINENGILMVPVRAVAEALDFNVEWFDDTRTVQVGKSLLLAIDKDEYSYNRMSPVSLGTAPVIKDDRTYVPIDFFTSELLRNENITYDFSDSAITITSK